MRLGNPYLHGTQKSPTWHTLASYKLQPLKDTTKERTIQDGDDNQNRQNYAF